VIRQASKMKRHKGKLRMDTALNLVSLMDIFTILLLFLLVQSSAEEVLPASKTLQLPLSLSRVYHKPSVTVFVTRDEIVVEGIKVGKVEEILRNPELAIAELEKELSFQTQKTLQIARYNPSVRFEGRVTIMGDRDIPFALLKKVMVSCSRSGYPHIALAVIQREKVSDS